MIPVCKCEIRDRLKWEWRGKAENVLFPVSKDKPSFQCEHAFRQTRGGVAVVFEEQRPRPDAAPAPADDPPAATVSDAASPSRALVAPLAADYSDVAFAGDGAQLPAFLGRERGGGADAQEEGLLRHPVIFRELRQISRE